VNPAIEFCLATDLGMLLLGYSLYRYSAFHRECQTVSQLVVPFCTSIMTYSMLLASHYCQDAIVSIFLLSAILEDKWKQLVNLTCLFFMSNTFEYFSCAYWSLKSGSITCPLFCLSFPCWFVGVLYIFRIWICLFHKSLKAYFFTLFMVSL
jgi:hypothetical protein